METILSGPGLASGADGPGSHDPKHPDPHRRHRPHGRIPGRRQGRRRRLPHGDVAPHRRRELFRIFLFRCRHPSGLPPERVHGADHPLLPDPLRRTGHRLPGARSHRQRPLQVLLPLRLPGELLPEDDPARPGTAARDGREPKPPGSSPSRCTPHGSPL